MGPLKIIFLYCAFHYCNSVEIKNIKKSRININKCCNETDYVLIVQDQDSEQKFCKPYNGNFSYNDLKVYTYNIQETGKNFVDTFNLVTGKFSNTTFTDLAFDYESFGLHTYLTEEGIVFLENPNAFKRWSRLDREFFCVDYELMLPDNSSKARVFSYLENEYIPQSSAFFTIANIISCVFLALTMLVYALLPHMRNLCGMVRMAYVGSQFGAFLTLAILQRESPNANECIMLTISIYFCFLSSFCWMNIMSFDIWWTFRGYAKARAIHRRGEMFKFLMYCLYGWGVPLVMTITLIVLNSVDLSSYPWIVTPNLLRNGCFLEGGEKLLYLYIPMLILILCNWLFFLMTAFNIWRLSRDTAVLNSAASGTAAAHRFQKQRLAVYLKLSVIMGVNWILEVISSLKPELVIWYFTDAYNLLIGIAVFIIFVCTRKTKAQLKGRLSGIRMSVMSNSIRGQNGNSSSATLDSSISPDGTQVSTNPQYRSK